jgi:hypothetical protein
MNAWWHAGLKPATANGHLAGKLSVFLYGLLKAMKPHEDGQHRGAPPTGAC